MKESRSRVIFAMLLDGKDVIIVVWNDSVYQYLIHRAISKCILVADCALEKLQITCSVQFTRKKPESWNMFDVQKAKLFDHAE
jgi:hypothetical protein